VGLKEQRVTALVGQHFSVPPAVPHCAEAKIVFLNSAVAQQAAQIAVQVAGQSHQG
jgi:hypothetical protein